METIEIGITTPYIKLDSLLKFSGIAESGSFAKLMIQQGEVCVNGEEERARGKKIIVGDVITVHDTIMQVIEEKK